VKLVRKLVGQGAKAAALPDASTLSSPDSMGNLAGVSPLPQDVLRLLWFLDGSHCNYVPSEDTTSFEAGPVTVHIGFGVGEPSAISVALPIAPNPVDWSSVPDPPYYPAYASLSPRQRRKYLAWLIDVRQEIQIGYVFVFYYGLERHLFFGRADEAFDMVLRLRQTHRHSSFLFYSEAALIASATYHKRPDLLGRYVESTSGATVPEMSNLYLLAKAALDIPLTPEEIVAVGEKLLSPKRWHLPGEPEIVNGLIEESLLRRYGQPALPLSVFPIADWPRGPQVLVANISFAQEQRSAPVPQLLRSTRFREEISSMLTMARDGAVARLKDRSGSVPGALASVVEPVSQPLAPQRLREGHALFRALDTKQFDRNVDSYNSCVCPGCRMPLPKRPESAMKCPSCNVRVRARSISLTGQKGLFREDELDSLKAVADECARRNFLCDMMEGQQLSSRSIKVTMARKGCAVEEALLEATANKALEHRQSNNMGLCRNALLHSGQIHRRMGDAAGALTRFLQVSYYDVNGCVNAGGLPGTPMFDLQSGTLVAPAVLGWIQALAQEQHMTAGQLRVAFLHAVHRISEPGMPYAPEQGWDVISRQLWPSP